MTAATRSRARFSDWQRLTDEGYVVELINGEIVPREAARGTHGSAQAKVAGVLDPFNRRAPGPKGPGGWLIMIEVEVFYDQTEEVYRHDVVAYRRERLEVAPADVPIRLRPDWACEVLSPSTASRDLVVKWRTLHLHGVPHYWVVDPERGTVTVYEHATNEYVKTAAGRLGDRVVLPPFREIDVSELLGR